MSFADSFNTKTYVPPPTITIPPAPTVNTLKTNIVNQGESYDVPPSTYTVASLFQRIRNKLRWHTNYLQWLDGRIGTTEGRAKTPWDGWQTITSYRSGNAHVYYLPAGGTWAYYMMPDNGAGVAGIAAGGTKLFQGQNDNYPYKCSGFCWKIG